MNRRTWTYYLVQQPPSLEQLATVKLGDWISLEAETAISIKSQQNDTGEKERLTRVTETIRNILECNVPRPLHDKLFVEGIRALATLKEKTGESDKDERTRNIIEQMTEALFTKHVKYIRLDVNVSIFQSALCFKSYLLSGLTDLEINSYNCGREDDDIKIIQILKGLPNLIRFSCSSHTFSTTNILRCLADNCKFIEYLNISHNSVSGKDVESITEVSDLKILNLNYTYVSKAQAVSILQSCKKLEQINIDTYTLESAIEEIQSNDATKETKLNLRVFYDCVNSTYEKFKLFVLMCPNIEKAYLTNYSRGVEYLSPLYHVKNLTELELTCFDFYDDKVKELLELSGHNLIVLNFSGIGQFQINALRHIGQTCPKLESLSVDQLIPDVVLEPFNMFTSQLALSDVPIFNKLRKLRFQNDNFDSSKGLVEELMFLLCNSPNIEDIYTWVPITDDIMLTILDRNPFVHLRELVVYESQLTESVIEKITANSVNFTNILNVLPDVDFDDYNNEYC